MSSQHHCKWINAAKTDATSTLQGCLQSLEFIQSRVGNVQPKSSQRRNKYSPNSPVEYKVWAEEHCRSVRGVSSKASTPLCLWAELPTSNTETLSGKTPLGCAWKCQRMWTKRQQALLLHKVDFQHTASEEKLEGMFQGRNSCTTPDVP